MKRLAFLSTHPIQYQSRWFQSLANHPKIDLCVFYCHQATPVDQAAAGFGVEFDWDVSLLDGYPHRFLRNLAHKPSIHTFGGMDTPEIKEIINEKSFDAVIINGWNYKSAWQAMRTCWRTKTPVMVRSDSHLRTDRGMARRAAKDPFYRWFIPRLNACLPVGTLSREYFLHYGARAERLFIVPHTLDDARFTKESARWLPQRDELRAEWKIDREAVMFLFAGKFIEKKRPLDFIKAVDHAAQNGARVWGVMAGDGPLRAECENFARSRNIPVTFLGFLNQSEIARAYVAADALVLPSDNRETWGLVVNEAMVCGRACLVSDAVGCAPDLIVSGETGESFPMGDYESLGRLMIRYSQAPDDLREMGANAKRQMAGYSVEAAVEAVVRAIDSVSNGKRL